MAAATGGASLDPLAGGGAASPDVAAGEAPAAAAGGDGARGPYDRAPRKAPPIPIASDTAIPTASPVVNELLFAGGAPAGGKRGSDGPRPAPTAPRHDRELEAALARDAIEVRFQPQIEPLSGRIAGVEALARWDGAAGPEALFARAEAAGLAERLSRTVQRKALRMAGSWNGALAGLRLSVNILPRDLDRSGFEAWLLKEIAAAGLNPARVTAEIVESALLSDRPAVALRLARLRAQGLEADTVHRDLGRE